jgi:hypothetical protein
LAAQTNQTAVYGSVSFISSENVYVQFVNTDGIQIGDSLYIDNANKFIPVLIVKNLSGISCACHPVNNAQLPLSKQVIAFIKKPDQHKEVLPDKSKDAVAVNDQSILSFSENKMKKESPKMVDGRFSISSYSDASSNPQSYFSERLRYNLSLNVNHISHTPVSAETSLSFTHKLGEIPILSDAFRIYSLALNYDLSKSIHISVGRKINPSLANIGAVDGINIENTGKVFSFGAVAGSRPNMINYGFNPVLFEYGAYVGHQWQMKNLYSRTTLAFFNQDNNGMTDRRFAYLQHSNSFNSHLMFFGSAEVDLYGKVNKQLTTKIDLSSVYLSLQYRPFQKVSMSLYYDARKNVYYYETFKNYVDSLIDKETRQGFRFQINYQPFENIFWGGFAGYRMPNTNYSSSINGYSYLTYSQLPLIDASLTVDVTYLKTNDVSGPIYEATLARDFLKNKLYVELGYQNVNYSFLKTNSGLNQNIGDINFSWRITKYLFLSAYYEATFDSDNTVDQRVFLNITQRF